MRTMNIFIFPLLTILFMAISHMGHAQNFDISPAPTPTSDAQSLDQVIAYSLMVVALVITYMLH
ncbi:putative arabinogalactan peptide, AGP [Medicago truncatula]|uniref:Putative arabinogalactan peptide, AGP n=1 Tax=Medicago truncatula TaxID=3880 RepID=A0A396HHS4_MEDTR|nr:putative arabinogalactan peptide, AGP [Medicago truncatula]